MKRQPELVVPVKCGFAKDFLGVVDGGKGVIRFTLASINAWRAQEKGGPCAWLAKDSQHSLALGIVRPERALNH